MATAPAEEQNLTDGFHLLIDALKLKSRMVKQALGDGNAADLPL